MPNLEDGIILLWKSLSRESIDILVCHVAYKIDVRLIDL